MPTPEQIRTAVQRHADYWNGDDHSAWRAGFTENWTTENPAGTPPQRVGDFKAEWDATHSDRMRTTVEVLNTLPSGAEGAAYMRARLRVEGQPDDVSEYIRKNRGTASCPSTGQKNRRSGRMISSSKVVAFTALQAQRQNAKPKQ